MAQRLSAISLAALLLAGLAQPTPAPRSTLSSSYQMEGAAHDGFVVVVADDAGAALPDPVATPVGEVEGQAFVPAVAEAVPVPTPAVVRSFLASVSAYCITGVTRSGTYTRPGVVATDRSVIPQWTRMRIDGLPGEYVSEDTGSAVIGAKVDVYMPSCQAAIQWGRQHRTIHLLS
jgi:N-acetylmuramoyl-L-alanine amidase